MSTPLPENKIVLLTGMSGAGKSTATKSLEDVGFRTIDNLPNDLIPALLEKIRLQPERFARLCLVVDARDGDPRSTIDAVRGSSVQMNAESRVVYLDSRDDVLIRRFSETRHRHPLGGPMDAPSDVAGAIRAERLLLSSAREVADAVIDTSDLAARELRDRLVEEVLGGSASIGIHVTSFGYKHGVPLDADLVFDVRSVANPHWVPELRPKDGRDREVATYVLSDPAGRLIEAAIREFVFATMDTYVRDGRGRLSIAVGCTGGRHRSVAISEALVAALRQRAGAHTVNLHHRDVDRT
ncbi:MAG: RNase adapter RapZ [bacterium]|nr:RNase adapter RapZ [Chloroflexota bacterium]NBO52323.1 RNase adapter RapZ [Candidatus Aquidulcis sp.]